MRNDTIAPLVTRWIYVKLLTVQWITTVPCGRVFLNTRYQPQRALDLFSSRIGAKLSQVKRNAEPLTSVESGKLNAGSHIIPETTEKKNGIDVVSTVVDVLSLDEPHGAVPQGRNPTEKKYGVEVVSNPSRNPYSWSTVVDALSLDEPHRAVPQGRNPIGASRAADEVTSLPGWEGALPSKHFSGCVHPNPLPIIELHASVKFNILDWYLDCLSIIILFMSAVIMLL